METGSYSLLQKVPGERERRQDLGGRRPGSWGPLGSAQLRDRGRDMWAELLLALGPWPMEKGGRAWRRMGLAVHRGRSLGQLERAIVLS